MNAEGERQSLAITLPPASAERGVAVPQSNVRAALDRHDQFGAPGEVNIHCGDCDRRVFDVLACRRETYTGHDLTLLYVERCCPRCSRICTSRITHAPGYPDPYGESGRWVCECGGYLGHIDAVRGRVTVLCRCGGRARVTAIAAVRAVEQDQDARWRATPAAAGNVEAPASTDHSTPEQDDIDELPF